MNQRVRRGSSSERGTACPRALGGDNLSQTGVSQPTLVPIGLGATGRNKPWIRGQQSWSVPACLQQLTYSRTLWTCIEDLGLQAAPASGRLSRGRLALA